MLVEQPAGGGQAAHRSDIQITDDELDYLFWENVKMTIAGIV